MVSRTQQAIGQGLANDIEVIRCRVVPDDSPMSLAWRHELAAAEARGRAWRDRNGEALPFPETGVGAPTAGRGRRGAPGSKEGAPKASRKGVGRGWAPFEGSLGL